MSEELKQLTELSRELLEGCKKTASDGTVLFTPDGVGNYDALWVRDLGYMAEYWESSRSALGCWERSAIKSFKSVPLSASSAQ